MILAAVLVDAAPAMAGFNEGVAAHRRGDYATALSEFRPLAQAGDAEAQYIVGGMYALGQGVDQDLTKAREWYLRAAEQGHTGAFYSLGVMDYFGNGVRKNYVSAAKWFRKAAEGGHVQSQVNLATMYVLGQGMWRDAVKARYWFRRAAEQGDPLAQFNLGMLYELGEGTERSPGKAAYWYRKSASLGFEDAARRVAALHDVASIEPDPLEPEFDTAQETALGEPALEPAADSRTDDASPAEPAEATVAAAASGEAGGVWRVHLASYRSPEGVRKGWNVLTDELPGLLAKLDHSSERIDLGAEKGIFYRLVAGHFASEDAARAFCDSYKGKKPGAWCKPMALAR